MILNKRYRRKTFDVEAIQVTHENMQGIAEWCGGRVTVYWPDIHRQSGDYRSGQTCVEIVIGSVNGREQLGRAYPGDWVTRLVDTANFRVYREKSFNEAFHEVLTEYQKRRAVLTTLNDFLDNRKGAETMAQLEKAVENFVDEILKATS